MNGLYRGEDACRDAHLPLPAGFPKAGKTRRNLRMLLILLIAAVADICAHLAGGTEEAVINLLFIPIILSAFFWGFGGALGTALIGGFLLGPFTPLNVNMEQKQGGWIFMITVYIMIGFIAALLFHRMKDDETRRIEQSFRDVFTGLPNMNKLRLDLDELVAAQYPFSLAAFRILNIDDINRYVDYDTGKSSILKAIEVLETQIPSDRIYYMFNHEIVAVLPEGGLENAGRVVQKFLEEFREPVSINGFSVELVMKGGMVHYPMHAGDTNDLIKKLGMTLAQGPGMPGMYVYDVSMEQENKRRYEIMASLHNALKNNEFFLVYQPKISLCRRNVLGFEALLRWNHGTAGRIGPEEFVMIAENAGMICEITKWVVKNIIDQQTRWRAEGIAAKVSFNVSSRDLRDDALLEYIRRYGGERGIDPASLEIELTERGIVENEAVARKILNESREAGIKVSLDDYGAGYNSLMTLAKLPIDYLKIDKYFIGHIKSTDCRIILEGIIHTAHGMGKEVIAEGVEDAEQLEILCGIGCDYVQGYYFSRPIPPEQVGQFIADFTDGRPRLSNCGTGLPQFLPDAAERLDKAPIM